MIILRALLKIVKKIYKIIIIWIKLNYYKTNNFIEHISHEQHRLSLYITPEPPTPEPLTSIKSDTYNKNRKLRRPTLYNTPEPPIPEPLTPLKNRITIFLQTPMKEVIPSPELGCFKRKTRRTKVAVVKTTASMYHKRLR